MTTIINGPGGGEETNSLASVLIAVILLVLVGGLLFVYVWPNIKGAETPKADTIDVNVTLPTTPTAPTTDKVNN